MQGKLVLALGLLCPSLVAAFCPSIDASKLTRHVALLQQKSAQHGPGVMSLRASSDSATPSTVVFLTAVLGKDVDTCTRLLTTNGAQVEVADANYGSKIIARLDTELLLRLAPQIAQLVKPSGRLEIAPLRKESSEKLVKSFSADFEDLREIVDDDSSLRVTGWRKDPWMVPGFSSIQVAKEREAYQTDSTFWKWVKVIPGQNSPYFKEEGPYFKDV